MTTFTIANMPFAKDVATIAARIEQLDQVTLEAAEDAEGWDLELANLQREFAVVFDSANKLKSMALDAFVIKRLEQATEVIEKLAKALPERITYANEKQEKAGLSQRVLEAGRQLQSLLASPNDKTDELHSLQQRVQVILLNPKTKAEDLERLLVLWAQFPPPIKSQETVQLEVLIASLDAADKTAVAQAVKELPEKIKNTIYEGTWKAFKEPTGDPHFGENHVCDDLGVLKTLLQQAL